MQVWRSRCAVTNRRFGGHICLTLTRWDPTLPPVPYNLVLLMQNEAQKLYEQGHAAFAPEVVRAITERLAWAKKVCEDSWETLDHTGGKEKCPIVEKPVKSVAAVSDSGSAQRGACAVQGHWALSVAAVTAAFLVGYGSSRLLNK
jgi:hypothetical protein